MKQISSDRKLIKRTELVALSYLCLFLTENRSLFYLVFLSRIFRGLLFTHKRIFYLLPIFLIVKHYVIEKSLLFFT